MYVDSVNMAYLGERITVTNDIFSTIEGDSLAKVEVFPVPEATIRMRDTLTAHEAALIQP